jgi:hypothetical protein
MLTIDKFGRRPVLIIGNLVNCLTFIIVAILLGKRLKPMSTKNHGLCKTKVVANLFAALFPPSSNSGGTAGWGFIIV